MDAHQKTGITILEMMLVLAIISTLIIAFQTPITEIHRFVLKKQWQSAIWMDWQRFLLLAKNEITQAGYGLSPSEWSNRIQIEQNHLLILNDWNVDGDFFDAKERIEYEYRAEEQALFRKSGKGSFQKFIVGIIKLEWEMQSENRRTREPLCITYRFILRHSEQEETATYCAFSP